jgi:outer membrane protein assembly factor BamA
VTCFSLQQKGWFDSFRATFFLCAVALAVAGTAAKAQDSLWMRPVEGELKDSTYYVDRILVSGNDYTRDFVVLREMTLKPGSMITKELIEYDKNRIYSLGLFNKVDMQAIPSADSNATIVVNVTERWYIYPYPIVGIWDRDWSKVYYGLGLLHMNFRGRNEKLIASFALGYNPWIQLSYRNPFLSDDGSNYLEARVGTNVIQNKSLLAMAPSGNFDERHYNISLTLGERAGITTTGWLSAGYEVVRVSQYNQFTTLSPSGEDKYPVFSGGFTYDSRDLAEYPYSGSFIRGTITKFGIPSTLVNIIRYAADVREYVPLRSRLGLAMRVMTDVAAAGKTPSYNRIYFGYNERIRGHFNDVREGESILGGTVEVHYTLLSARYFKTDLLPPAFGVWRFGLVAEVFGDAGTVWFRGNPVVANLLEKGYGAGLDVLLPYSTVVHLDYALNEARKGEFIIDLGSSF